MWNLSNIPGTLAINDLHGQLAVGRELAATGIGTFWASAGSVNADDRQAKCPQDMLRAPAARP